MRTGGTARRLARGGTLLLAALLLAAAAGRGDAPVDDHESHAGELLVADPDMPDPRFRESVILMLRHDRDGAMGLIVNKTITVAPLALLFRDPTTMGPGFEREVAIRYGGPVETSKGFVLHRRDYAIAGTVPVANGYAFTSNMEIVEAMGQGKGPTPAAVAFGYAGWGPGQLEREIARGDWQWVPADDDLIFAERDDGKWRTAWSRRGVDL